MFVPANADDAGGVTDSAKSSVPGRGQGYEAGGVSPSDAERRGAESQRDERGSVSPLGPCLVADRHTAAVAAESAREAPGLHAKPTSQVHDAAADPRLEACALADERARIDVIARVSPAVVCVLDENRAGGGSGVIIDADGHGLTNFHVIAGLLKTRRGLGGLDDGKLYRLEVLGIDPTGDVAMFRLTGRPRFAFAELGDSDAVRVGDWVMAMGNPFLLAEDYTPTVTLGIVSGVRRYQWGAGGKHLVYSDCLQVDASINPGNSGGPLFDRAGRLIGINGRAAFEERGRVNVGLGFAISINQIQRFIPALRAGRLVEHGTLGATVTDAAFRCVVFDQVADGAAAQRAGIRLGDRLHSFAGRPICSANEFTSLLGTFPAGWPVEIEVSTPPSDERRRIRVILDRLPVPAPEGYETDETVTRRAAASAPVSGPGDVQPPRPPGNVCGRAVRQALASVVKLYGAGTAGERGYGSGVIVSADGLVVSAQALLLEAETVRAVTADGRLYRADVKHRDPGRQLALLQLRPYTRGDGADAEPDTKPADSAAPPAAFQPLEPGTSASLRPGDWVIALGNPFKVADGEEPVSVLKGVFSARTRLDARHHVQDFPYRGDVLIVDAITGNPGSQGGALVDLDGRWVGLVGRAAHSYLTNTRLNYAVPIEEVVAFLNEARTGRPLTPAPASTAGRGYHGIRLFSLAYRQGLPFVERVDLGSPADRAGLRKEDLILSANGVPTANSRAFQRTCDGLAPGDELILAIKRGQELLTVRLTLEKPPE